MDMATDITWAAAAGVIIMDGAGAADIITAGVIIAPIDALIFANCYVR
jgi:hypothetical protein